MQHIIENFTAFDLFGRDNYEFYARVTGRVLRVQDEWIFSFRYPPPPRGKSAQQHYACRWSPSGARVNSHTHSSHTFLSVQLALQTEKTWLQCQCDRWGLGKSSMRGPTTCAVLTNALCRCRPRRISIDARPCRWWCGRRQQCNLVGHHSGALVAGVLRPAVGVAGGTGHLLQPVDVLLVRLHEVRRGGEAAAAARGPHDDGGADGGEQIRGEHEEPVLVATSEFRCRVWTSSGLATRHPLTAAIVAF